MPTPDAPPVLLLHGFAASADRTWLDNGWIDLLGDLGREVLALDLLGHGDADKPHEPEAYADMEGELLSRFPPGRVAAVGFSLGARTLLRLAAAHPERFERLVVSGVGANLFSTDPDRGRDIAEAIEGRGDPTNVEARHFSELADAPGSDRAALVACMRRSSPPMTPEELATVTMPVLVVLGDRDFAGPADPLLSALPDARLTTLRNVDHFATPKAMGFLDAALGFLGP